MCADRSRHHLDLGHANLGTTSIDLQGIDPEEIIATVHTAPGPVMSASAGLRL
jgi:predicted HAD superfamily Cof-like phosphohydrolase